MTKPKNAYTYRKAFSSELDRNVACLRLVDSLRERKIKFVKGWPIGKAHPDYQDFLLDVQRINRLGNEPYELYTQVYSKKQIMPSEIPYNISEALSLEGLVLVG